MKIFLVAVILAGDRLVWAAMNQLNLSARGYHRVLKLARTIADLAGSEGIQICTSGGGVAVQAKVDDGLRSLLFLRTPMQDNWWTIPIQVGNGHRYTAPHISAKITKTL